jgi:hypothetical protein
MSMISSPDALVIVLLTELDEAVAAAVLLKQLEVFTLRE